MSNKLGRGLDKLFAGAKAKVEAAEVAPVVEAAKTPAVVVLPATGEPARVSLSKIDPNPWQPRRDFRADELDDLVTSLRENGLLQPVTLRRRGDRYEIIAGERRVRAARLLEWTSIPALVREADDREMLQLAILENLQRSDLNPMDVAAAYRRLMEEFRLTQEEVSKKVGSSRSQVANTLRLLDLQAEIRVMLSKGEITAGAGRALLAFDEPRRRLELARQVVAGSLTVRQLEELAQSTRKPAVRPPGPRPPAPDIVELGNSIARAIGMKVAIRGNADRGTMTIRYGDKRQLDALWRALSTKPTRSARPLEDDDDDTIVT